MAKSHTITHGHHAPALRAGALGAGAELGTALDVLGAAAARGAGATYELTLPLKFG